MTYETITTTRHVCTYLNPFSMVIPIIIMTFYNFILFCFALQDAEHQAQGRPEWRRIMRKRAKGHAVLRLKVKSSQVLLTFWDIC